jgi:hypothetical protein
MWKIETDVGSLFFFLSSFPTSWNQVASCNRCEIWIIDYFINISMVKTSTFPWWENLVLSHTKCHLKWSSDKKKSNKNPKQQIKTKLSSSIRTKTKCSNTLPLCPHFRDNLVSLSTQLAGKSCRTCSSVARNSEKLHLFLLFTSDFPSPFLIRCGPVSCALIRFQRNLRPR